MSRLVKRTATVCIVGLGYVGVPLAVASGRAGFNVVGVDVDKSKVDSVNRGVCHVEDPYSEKFLPGLAREGKVKATTSLEGGTANADVVIICVQTPLSKSGRPDLSYVRKVARGLSRLSNRFRLVILESTSYPGTTQEELLPILENSRRRHGRDFALVYSPERIDYGNPGFNVSKIPKVVGGVDAVATDLGAKFYEAILDAPVLKVSNPSVAEASKMLENIFRYVNIALVNELAMLHEKLGVDFLETIEAAASKPFGFMPHYPGPGVGGHCIPKDPFYLVYKANKAGIPLRLVAAAKTVNTMMPGHVVERLKEALAKEGMTMKESSIAVWGLAYKGQVRDARRSPSLDILRLLGREKARVRVYDPFVPSVVVGRTTYKSSRSLSGSVDKANCVILATAHDVFKNVDLKKLRGRMAGNPIMFDTRNILKREACESAGFRYLGTGRPYAPPQ